MTSTETSSVFQNKWVKNGLIKQSFNHNDRLQMAIIAQKVYQKCKIWLLFAMLSLGINNCTKDDNAGFDQIPKEWLAAKAEIETYSAIDSSKAFSLVKKVSGTTSKFSIGTGHLPAGLCRNLSLLVQQPPCH